MATFTSSIISSLLLILLFVGASNGQLSSNFYSSSCPNLLSIVRTAVRSAVSSEARMGASLLRLHFHDCFVQGCDASVLLDDTANFTGEKTAAPNAGSLRGFDVIDNIKTQVERACPGVVSCADILALAARDGVVALNGPSWSVGLGRRDSTTASLSGANSQIPAPTLNLNALISSFSNKGFTAREMVALSGSHTIGQARCVTFRNRLYNEANIDPAFANSTRRNCPQSGGNNNLSPLDVVSPNAFNNDYFRNLVNLRGLLHSDQQLFSNGSTDAQVRSYTTNSASFFNDFAAAMVKMAGEDPCPCLDSGLTRECGPSCNCDSGCGNRVSQGRVSIKMKIIKDERKGWGLFSAQSILNGQFICEYAGELLSTKEARQRQQTYDKLSSSGHLIPALLVVKEHLPSGNTCMRINIDATRIGNVARFINHSCDGGNLDTVIVRSSGALLPRICFFASRDIQENEELTFSYGGIRINSVGRRPCFCGSSSCEGILPSEDT